MLKFCEYILQQRGHWYFLLVATDLSQFNKFIMCPKTSHDTTLSEIVLNFIMAL